MFDERRRQPDKTGLYGAKPTGDIKITKVFSGDWHVTDQENEMLSTILGSCVSACIRDPIAKVGGMNHFLLPGDENTVSKISEAARYGVFAMESLINEILKRGGHRIRLEIKVFGGGNVIKSSTPVGTRNAQFVREFLKREGFRIAAEDLEGQYPRSLHYYPVSGKVMVRKLRRLEDLKVVEEEKRYSKLITSKPIEGNIELF